MRVVFFLDLTKVFCSVMQTDYPRVKLNVNLHFKIILISELTGNVTTNNFQMFVSMKSRAQLVLNEIPLCTPSKNVGN